VWRGLPWGALESIEHTPRRGLLRDGRIVLHPHNVDRVLAELDSSGRRQSAWSQRLHGAPLAVPLGLSTRVGDLSEDLTTSLRMLAGATTHVVEVAPSAPESTDTADFDDLVDDHRVSRDSETDGQYAEIRSSDPKTSEDRAHDTAAPRPARLATALITLRTRVAERLVRADRAADDADLGPGQTTVGTGSGATGETTAPIVASPTPRPLREATSVARIEIRSNLVLEGTAARKLDESATGNGLPEGRELRRDGSVSLVEDTVMWGDRVRPIATAGEAVEPLVIDDFAVEPATEPVIGPDIAAARTRIGLSIDALADRTRIRPHVLESIEVDDFHACGGDFYARGHLRTLARVLGLDAAPLLTAYDEKYADAPINARRVFEAELGTGAGGGLRATKGGPNWSLMIAVVMTLVLAWSIARLAMDSPVEIQNPAPILNGSDGPNQTAPMSENVTLKVSSTSSTQLEVRDGNKLVVFDDSVDYGEVHRIDVLPPVRVTAEDAGAIEVEIDGEPRGSLGQDGKEASKSYRAATDKD
ncbi:MAG TPA: helix-turn-helix domain-containing protein, partial [Nocardioides sp.]